MMNIGERLRALRESAGYSQVKIARLAGTNQPSIGRYENGVTAPPIKTLLWYADYFDVSLDYIFGRTPDPCGKRFKTEGEAEQRAPVIVRDILLASAEAHPDLTAYMVKDARTEPYRPITYREAMNEIFALGARLCDMGLSGKRIAVIGDNCYEWALTYFAVLFGAGVIVPLDKELRPEEVTYLLQYGECSAVFYTDRFDEVMAGIDFIPYKIRMKRYDSEKVPVGALTCKRILEEGKALSRKKIDAFKKTPIDENALAALLFTSGTTGNAKGVLLSNRGMGTNISDMRAAHNVKPGGSTVSILPMHHCFEAVMGQQFMLANGVAIAFGDGLKYIQRNMEEVRPTVMLFVPLLLENFYNKILRGVEEAGRETDLQRRINDYLKLRQGLGPEDDSKAREAARKLFKEELSIFGGRLDSVFTGAAAINPRVIRGLQEIGLKITYGYGMTECGPLMTTTPYFSDTMAKPGSVGPSVPSGMMRIDKPDAKGIGEICYRGPTVMLGYYGKPEESVYGEDGEWFHSGDYGVLDDDGWLYITGREANIIITKTGKNVFPEELEATLSCEPYIEEIMVYASVDKKRGGALISAQVRPDYAQIADALGAGFAEDEARVEDLIRGIITDFNEGLANYKRIRHVQIRREEFVKTPTKKLVRSRNI
ncbi:MAG: AMP-binding protein [Clostridiales Family XIII bacterium]|jgi:long-chain acyl-CoA synthetase|nr:AMP-binding protein [Clostridiales Family XIII bacterium]